MFPTPRVRRTYRPRGRGKKEISRNMYGQISAQNNIKQKITAQMFVFSGETTREPDIIRVQDESSQHKTYVEESTVMAAIKQLDQKFDNRMKDMTTYFMTQLL
jgi:hypothetical protein